MEIPRNPKSLFEKPQDGRLLDFNEISIESLGAHLFFGDVDATNVKSCSEFILKANQLFKARPLSIFLNTLGGAVGDGFALIDIMSISNLPIRTIGVGNICSMGVLLLCAGSPGQRIITRNCTIMAHQFSSDVSGKFHELMADYRAEVYLKHQFMEHFKKYSTMDDATIDDVLFASSDRYLTPAECKKYGLVDQIVDQLPDFNIEMPTSSLLKPVRPRKRR